MAADSTLVSAAFKEATSRAGLTVPNMKPIYDSNRNIFQTGQKFVTGLIEMVKTKRDAEDAQKEMGLMGFNKIVDNTHTKLFEMGEPMPNKVVDALDRRIEELKKAFEDVNTIGDGDTKENNTARLKIMAELKRITGNVVDTRKNLMDISGSREHWNANRMDFNNFDTYKSFLDVEGMDANNNVDVNYIPQKGLTFTNLATGKSYTMKELREAIPTVDTEIKSYGETARIEAGRRGKNDGIDGKPNYYDKSNEAARNAAKAQVAGEFLNEIKDLEDFANASTIPLMSGTQSFQKALLNYAPITTSIVEKMYVNVDGEMVPIGETFARWDKDTDGDVDSEDMGIMTEDEKAMFLENHKEMVRAITDPSAPGFNLQVSKELLGSYFADLEEGEYLRQYDYQAKIKSNDGGEKNISGNYEIGSKGEIFNPAIGTSQYYGYKYDKSGRMKFNDVAFLKNIRDGKETYDAFGNKYEPVMRNNKFTGWFNISDAVGGKFISSYNKDKILGWGYQANENVRNTFDPNNYKK